MDGRPERGQKVVDLRRYRAERDRRQLPLFDGNPISLLTPVSPVRLLSAREVSHRERMLEHLKAVPRS